MEAPMGEAIEQALSRGLELADAEIRCAGEDLQNAQRRVEQEQANLDRHKATLAEWVTKRDELQAALSAEETDDKEEHRAD
jgi:hypothetical protein